MNGAPLSSAGSMFPRRARVRVIVHQVVDRLTLYFIVQILGWRMRTT